LVRADAARRAAFVEAYATLRRKATAAGATICFVDEAHFRADADLRGKWVLRGQPALVDSTSPGLPEKLSYYSAVCVETGEVEAMPVEDTCTAETSVAFLRHLRTRHREPRIVLWDNGAAHRGDPLRQYLAMPNVRLRLVALPACSPDVDAAEAIWEWTRDEVTANTCLGPKSRCGSG
jgi:transposase